MIDPTIKKAFLEATGRDEFIYSTPWYIRILFLLNNFWAGLIVGFLFWVLPFLDMARIIGDSIALNCGSK